MTKETPKTEGSNEAKAHAEAQATAKRLETTPATKPGETPNTVDETAAKKAAEIRSDADKLQEKVDSANSQADALLKTPAKPVAGSPVTAGTAADTDTSAAAKATEGNFSTKTVADNSGGIINDPDNPKKDLGDKDNVQTKTEPADDDEDRIPEIPDDETPIPTDDELDAIDLTESKASLESLNKVSKLVRDLKSVGTPENFTIYGYGGTIITLEDLDNLLD